MFIPHQSQHHRLARIRVLGPSNYLTSGFVTVQFSLFVSFVILKNKTYILNRKTYLTVNKEKHKARMPT